MVSCGSVVYALVLLLPLVFSLAFFASSAFCASSACRWRSLFSSRFFLLESAAATIVATVALSVLAMALVTSFRASGLTCHS